MKIYVTELKSAFQNFVVEPVIAGLHGFATYFLVLLFVKMIRLYIGFSVRFQVDINDVVLASVGFILVFLIKFLQNIKNRELSNE